MRILNISSALLWGIYWNLLGFRLDTNLRNIQRYCCDLIARMKQRLINKFIKTAVIERYLESDNHELLHKTREYFAGHVGTNAFTFFLP